MMCEVQRIGEAGWFRFSMDLTHTDLVRSYGIFVGIRKRHPFPGHLTAICWKHCHYVGILLEQGEALGKRKSRKSMIVFQADRAPVGSAVHSLDICAWQP